MTKKLNTHRGLSLFVLAVIATTSTGCRSSGFSMPKMKMFSWNRQPDAATLAGSTQPAGLPESPAAKYDPAALASATSKPSSSGNTAGLGSAYGYGATGSSAGAAPGSATQPGLAASANGYQTGPYQLAPKNTTAPSTSVASTATAGSLPSGTLPSPYGGTYSGTTSGLGTNTTVATKTDIPLPSSVTAALAQGAAGTSAVGGLPALPGAAPGSASQFTPALPAGYASNGTGQIPATTSAYQMLPTPPAYPTNNPYTSGSAAGSPSGLSTGMNPSSASLTGTPAVGVSAAAGLPAIPVTPSNTAGQAATSNPAAASSAYQSASPGPAPLATPPRVYTPGSTGRSTNYDFSGAATKSSGNLSTSSTPGGTQPLLR